MEQQRHPPPSAIIVKIPYMGKAWCGSFSANQSEIGTMVVTNTRGRAFPFTWPLSLCLPETTGMGRVCLQRPLVSDVSYDKYFGDNHAGCLLFHKLREREYLLSQGLPRELTQGPCPGANKHYPKLHPQDSQACWVHSSGHPEEGTLMTRFVPLQFCLSGMPTLTSDVTSSKMSSWLPDKLGAS